MEIDMTQVAKLKPKKFVTDIVIDNQVLRLEQMAMNLESLCDQLSFAAAAAIPRITGWNVYDDQGTLVRSVSAMDFYAKLGQSTTLKNAPADKSSAGWRPVPSVAALSPDLQKALEDAKREGRIPR